jgi:hypothetical protein
MQDDDKALEAATKARGHTAFAAGRYREAYAHWVREWRRKGFLPPIKPT